MNVRAKDSDDDFLTEKPEKAAKADGIVDMKFDVAVTQLFRKGVYILYDGRTYKNQREEATHALIRHILVMQCRMTPRQRAEFNDKLTAKEKELIKAANDGIGGE